MNVLLPARLIIFLILPAAHAQLLYLGIKGGTPFSSSGSSVMVGGRPGFGLSTLNVRHYTVGPTFEVAIPFGFRFEADALYKRLDTTEHRFFSAAFGSITRFAANSWEFPVGAQVPMGTSQAPAFRCCGGRVPAHSIVPSEHGIIRGRFSATSQPGALSARTVANPRRHGIRRRYADHQRRANEGDAGDSIHQVDVAQIPAKQESGRVPRRRWALTRVYRHFGRERGTDRTFNLEIKSRSKSITDHSRECTDVVAP